MARSVDAIATHRPPGGQPIATRLWEASRTEFSLRGYHGARVQGIARRAGCNVALLYRHWASKKALYAEVLRSVFVSMLGDIAKFLERGHGAPAVVDAYLDANLRDPTGARIMLREFLDGGPFMSELLTAEPSLAEPIRRAARTLASDAAGAPPLRAGLDPMLAVLSIGGLAALVSSGREGAEAFFSVPVAAEVWRQHLYDLLLHGVLEGPAGGRAAART